MSAVTKSGIETLLARQDGWQGLVVTQNERTTLRRSCSLADISYAFGQIACLLAAHRKRVYGGTEWPSNCDELPRNITAEELCHEARQPDSLVVTAALFSTWHGHWPKHPDGAALPKGFSPAYVFMDRVGYVMFSPAENLQLDLTSAAAKSIKVQVGRAMKDLRSTWEPYNPATFEALLELLGEARLWFVQDIAL